MINIIAAIGKNRELGKDNKLLWHIPEDFKRFKTLTSGHIVIMGRKTFESLPEKFKPLPNRLNIVITRNKTFTYPVRPSQIGMAGLIVCHSMEEAIKNSEFRFQNSESGKEIFVIGGAEIYKQGIQYADKLYLTLIDKEYPEADAFFPDYSAFKKIIFEENHFSGEIKFKFIDLVK
ncbi:dihydrofolate reductase [Candidatus Roizmanbacteria bacterium]|nr:dihydrofolate reductase [Candidatus Roizmanbacteria bacterium]